MTEKTELSLNSKHQYLVTLEFELPIYIPLPDGVYEVLANSNVAKVRLRRVDKPTSIRKSVRASEGVFSYTPDLRYDPFNSTIVLLQFKPSIKLLRRFLSSDWNNEDPYTKGPINPLLEEALLFINKIVRAYQDSTGYVAIGQVKTWDIGISNITIQHLSSGSLIGVNKIQEIGYSRPTKHTKVPTDKETVKQIVGKVGTKWNIPIENRILMTARYLYLMGEFSTAVTAAQTAFEVFLSARLKSHLTHIIIHQKGKSKKIALKKSPTSIMIKYGIKQAIGKDFADIDSQLDKRVAKAIKLRNRFTHEGVEISMKDSDTSIKTYNSAMEMLASYF